MFRELIRKDKRIGNAECIELLLKETRGILSVNGDDGYPYGTPMNHFYSEEDGCIYFHCGKKGHRLDSIKRSDKASFCVYENGRRDHGDWAYNVRSVIVFGRIEIIDDLERIIKITTQLSHKFTSDEEYIKGETRRSAAATLLLKLTPEHMCGKLVKEA